MKSVHNLLFPTNDLCFFCKDRLGIIKDFICRDCRDRLLVVDKAVYMNSNYMETTYYGLSYNRYIRELVKDFKFHNNSYLYKPFGQIMINTMKKRNLYNMDLIIYVPSHRRKEAIRGYNQSELLAKYISESTKIEISRNNLIKNRSTKEQSKLNGFERINNLKGSLTLKYSGEIRGKKILLVDDIITTGTTMVECAKILKENGAKEIVGLALTSSK